MAAAMLLLLEAAGYASADSSSEYGITSEIVYSYKMKGPEAAGDIQKLLAELRAKNAELGNVWHSLMELWKYADTEQTANPGKLPMGLPTGKELCIIVLGFQLNDDGSMSDELIGRCEVALKCAEQYPSAYVAVTGGGTARDNKTKTEADQMAEWLEKKGVSKDRIIIENKSQTTVENAKFLGKILLELYPEITASVIVTSDYHVAQGALLFREFFLLSAYKEGSRDVPVLTNAAYETNMPERAESVAAEAADLWSLAEYMNAAGEKN